MWSVTSSIIMYGFWKKYIEAYTTAMSRYAVYGTKSAEKLKEQS